MPKTLTKKEYKTKQILELLKEISSPYEQIEIITPQIQEMSILMVQGIVDYLLLLLNKRSTSIQEQ